MAMVDIELKKVGKVWKAELPDLDWDGFQAFVADFFRRHREANTLFCSQVQVYRNDSYMALQQAYHSYQRTRPKVESIE